MAGAAASRPHPLHDGRPAGNDRPATRPVWKAHRGTAKKKARFSGEKRACENAWNWGSRGARPSERVDPEPTSRQGDLWHIRHKTVNRRAIHGLQLLSARPIPEILAMFVTLELPLTPEAQTIVDAVIEVAEQACRYALKYQEASWTPGEIDQQYSEGFISACELCERSVRPYVMSRIAAELVEAGSSAPLPSPERSPRSGQPRKRRTSSGGLPGGES